MHQYSSTKTKCLSVACSAIHAHRCKHGGSGLDSYYNYNLLRSLSVICTVVSGESTIMRSGKIIVAEAGMSVNLAVKVSFDSINASSLIST